MRRGTSKPGMSCLHRPISSCSVARVVEPRTKAISASVFGIDMNADTEMPLVLLAGTPPQNHQDVWNPELMIHASDCPHPNDHARFARERVPEKDTIRTALGQPLTKTRKTNATSDRALLRLLCARHCVGRFFRPYAGE